MARMTVSLVGGKVEISEGGRKGGNVRARPGRRVVWRSNPVSVSSFDLQFERLSEGEGLLESFSDWPFADVRAMGASSSVDHLDCKITNAKGVVVRVGDDSGIFKYSIAVTPNSGGAPVIVDPVIIIEK